MADVDVVAKSPEDDDDVRDDVRNDIAMRTRPTARLNLRSDDMTATRRVNRSPEPEIDHRAIIRLVPVSRYVRRAMSGEIFAQRRRSVTPMNGATRKSNGP